MASGKKLRNVASGEQPGALTGSLWHQGVAIVYNRGQRWIINRRAPWRSDGPIPGIRLVHGLPYAFRGMCAGITQPAPRGRPTERK